MGNAQQRRTGPVASRLLNFGPPSAPPATATTTATSASAPPAAPPPADGAPPQCTGCACCCRCGILHGPPAPVHAAPPGSPVAPHHGPQLQQQPPDRGKVLSAITHETGAGAGAACMGPYVSPAAAAVQPTTASTAAGTRDQGAEEMHTGVERMPFPHEEDEDEEEDYNQSGNIQNPSDAASTNTTTNDPAATSPYSRHTAITTGGTDTNKPQQIMAEDTSNTTTALPTYPKMELDAPRQEQVQFQQPQSVPPDTPFNFQTQPCEYLYNYTTVPSVQSDDESDTQLVARKIIPTPNVPQFCTEASPALPGNVPQNTEYLPTPMPSCTNSTVTNTGGLNMVADPVWQGIQSVPKVVPYLLPFTPDDVACGGMHMAVVCSGELLVWGGTHSTTQPQWLPISCGALTTWEASSSFMGYWNLQNELGAISASKPTVICPKVVSPPFWDGEYDMCSCGPLHTLALFSGRAYAMGSNDEGQLGVNDTEDRDILTPCQFGESAIVSVSGGGKHSAAISKSGNLFTWGSGSLGQLGLGDLV
ncbi:hypothetical protein Pelo_14242 [Pelomyxa schiedti]|nr:hypothetical protein Pelo_14242 [Pelomyxa schiedti]